MFEDQPASSNPARLPLEGSFLGPLRSRCNFVSVGKNVAPKHHPRWRNAAKYKTKRNAKSQKPTTHDKTGEITDNESGEQCCQT